MALWLQLACAVWETELLALIDLLCPFFLSAYYFAIEILQTSLAQAISSEVFEICIQGVLEQKYENKGWA